MFRHNSCKNIYFINFFLQFFISHSSKDSKTATAICTALEARGHECWMSSRDIKPGENFQGTIVRAIRESGVMVLVFSANANNSDEIKKEMALASQSKKMVIPVRAEDVLPSEDFTYERRPGNGSTCSSTGKKPLRP